MTALAGVSAVPAAAEKAGWAQPSAALTSPGQVALPLLWRDVARVGVLCLVKTARGVDTGALHRRLCGSAERVARAGAPVPVTQIGLGDRSILSPDSITLLVHASTSTDGGRALMALSVRPFRNGRNDPGLLFGAEPQAFILRHQPAGRDRLDEALAAALAQTLPWAERPTTRPVR